MTSMAFTLSYFLPMSCFATRAICLFSSNKDDALRWMMNVLASNEDAVDDECVWKGGGVGVVGA